MASLPAGVCRVRPHRLKVRAPWRWRWHLILGLLLRCGAWSLALIWSPFFGIALSFWVYAQLRAGYTEPLPSPTDGKGLDGKAAGQFVFTQDDPDRPNHWKVTQSE